MISRVDRRQRDFAARRVPRPQVADERRPAARQVVRLDRVDEHAAAGIGDRGRDPKVRPGNGHRDPVACRVRRLGAGFGRPEGDQDQGKGERAHGTSVVTGSCVKVLES
jgi:hypothetical protein